MIKAVFRSFLLWAISRREIPIKSDGIDVPKFLLPGNVSNLTVILLHRLFLKKKININSVVILLKNQVFMIIY